MTGIGARLAGARRGALLALFGVGFTMPISAAAQDDLAAAGEKVFRRCSACHAVGEGAKNKVGPELNAIIGRTAGGLEGYNYSSAMKEAGAGGLVWNEETLATYLADPKAMIPGTKMAFAGLKKEDDVAAVIAYMAHAGAGS